MKRIIGIILLSCPLFTHAESQMPAQANQHLLGSTAYVAYQGDVDGESSVPQPPYAEGSAAHAHDFLQRLNKTVQQGHALAATGHMEAQRQREHTLALIKLKEESESFSALAHPFAECNEAAQDALASWHALMGKNSESFTDNHVGYLGSANECLKAAG